jgi:hypothetical protein
VKYPSYCCQHCGLLIGWVGRIFQWVFPGMHECYARPIEKKAGEGK